MGFFLWKRVLPYICAHSPFNKAITFCHILAEEHACIHYFVPSLKFKGKCAHT